MNGEPVDVNFGCLPPLPPGYIVQWHPNLEHYMAHGPDEWESPISWNRYQCRGWCFSRSTPAAPTPPAGDSDA